MAVTRRTTLYPDPDVHKTLRMKAAVSEWSLSNLVNEAVRAALAGTQRTSPRSRTCFAT
ncbi:hypothetical protein H5T55_00245 [Candidatus Bipolaricaulota bacterium]|nr:hypothetical protein [Candidatus Bipolaricaulota bacterium]